MAAVSGHWGKSKKPECHPEGIDRLHIVTEEQPFYPGLQDPGEGASEVTDWSEPVAANEPTETSEPTEELESSEERWNSVAQWPDEAAAAPVHVVAPPARATYPPPPDSQPRQQSPRASASTRRTALARAPKSVEWRQPPPHEGPMSVHGPTPGMFRCTVELTTEVFALYEAFRADPDLAFEGDISQFICTVLPAYARVLGFDGIRLVRRVPQQLPAPVYMPGTFAPPATSPNQTFPVAI